MAQKVYKVKKMRLFMSSMNDQKNKSVPDAIDKKNKKRIGFGKTLLLALGATIGIGGGAAIIDKGHDFQQNLKKTQAQVEVYDQSISRPEIILKIENYVAGKYDNNSTQKEEIKNGIILQNPMLMKWNTKAHDKSELEVYSNQISKDLSIMKKIIINGKEFILK